MELALYKEHLMQIATSHYHTVLKVGVLFEAVHVCLYPLKHLLHLLLMVV